MDLIEAIFLGIVQGITEFLPISSSGHLVLFEHLFKIQPSLTFNVILHGATLIAIIVFFRKDFFQALKDFKIIVKLFVATIPIVIIGFLLKEEVELTFSSLKFVGFSFFVTAIILLATVFSNKKAQKSLGHLSLFDTFFIGLFQALAVLPGVSRSGATISSGLYRGAKKETAFKFAFLLGGIAILGALILEIPEISNFDFTPSVVVGFIFALLFSFLALKLLKKIVLHSKLYYFSIYCFALGLVCLILAAK